MTLFQLFGQGSALGCHRQPLEAHHRSRTGLIELICASNSEIEKNEKVVV